MEHIHEIPIDGVNFATYRSFKISLKSITDQEAALTPSNNKKKCVTGCMRFLVNRATETQLPVRLLSVFNLKMNDNITVMK